MKKCKKCDTIKEDDAFCMSKGKLYSTCKKCKNAYKKKWYGEGGQQWELTYKVFSRVSRTQHYLLSKAKERAKKKNIPFDITADDFIVPERCPILGTKLKSGDRKVCNTSPTIDRIRPELGYVKGNIQVVSYRANTLKSNATIEELLKVVEHLVKMR